MRRLALDLGTKTGWAIADDDRLIGFGTQTFELKRGESNGMRFLHFRTWLMQLYNMRFDPRNAGTWGPGFELILYELPHMRGGPPTDLLVGLQTEVQAFGALHGIQYQGMHTARLKKRATGSGNASKEDMIRAAQAQWRDQLVRLKRPIANDNEGDALCLLATWETENSTPKTSQSDASLSGSCSSEESRGILSALVTPTRSTRH